MQQPSDSPEHALTRMAQDKSTQDISPVMTEDEKARSAVDDDPPPEGGLTAWLTVVGSTFILFSTFGYVYSYGVYQDFYVRTFLTNYSATEIAWIGSFQILSPFLGGIISGKLLDDGYFHHISIAGGVIFVFSTFMLSLAKPNQYYQVFLSQAVGSGIGLGLTFVPSISITAHHFSRRRGLASGIVLSGSSVGGTIFPIMLNRLIPTIGFAKAVQATGYIILGSTVIGNLLMRTRLPPKEKRRQKAKPDVKSFLTDIPYMFSVLAGFCASLGIYFPIIYLQLYSVTHSVNRELAFYTVAIINGTSAFGRIFGNVLSDAIGPINVAIPVALCTGATIWAVLGIQGVGSVVAVSVLFGFFSGAWLSLVFLVLSAFANHTDEIGARVGVGVALGSLAALFAAPIQGSLLTRNPVTGEFNWLRPIIFSALMLMVCPILLLVPRIALAKRRGTQRV